MTELTKANKDLVDAAFGILCKMPHKESVILGLTLTRLSKEVLATKGFIDWAKYNQSITFSPNEPLNEGDALGRELVEYLKTLNAW